MTSQNGQIGAGIWEIAKNETNSTSESWFAWEILLPSENTIANLAGLFSSNLFAQVEVFTDRIVFFDGEVKPGETLLKSFELEQVTSGVMSMSHSRSTDMITNSEIQDGFDQLPLTESHQLVLSVSEPFSISLMAFGLTGILLRRKIICCEKFLL